MPRTTPTNGLKKATFLGVSEVRYESGVKLTNFKFSWQNGAFLWGQKCTPNFLNQNEELSKKNWCVYVYIQSRIRKYVTGGADLPPPTLDRVKACQDALCTYVPSKR